MCLTSKSCSEYLGVVFSVTEPVSDSHHFTSSDLQRLTSQFGVTEEA